jgi:two-component system, OmpR family, response regulator
VGQSFLQSPFPLRVLVVDDYQDTRDSTCVLLRIWGYQAESAADGQAALAAAPVFRPDVALIDLAMPGMDGYETARRLRELPEPPLLMALTGYGRVEDRLRTRRAGFDAHMLKPVEPEELRALLGRTAGLFRLARVVAAASEKPISVHRQIEVLVG